MKNVYELAGKYRGADIWIVAAGPTMDYVDPTFFENKITIGVNQVFRRFRTDYLLRKETAMFDEADQTGIPLIASRYNCATFRMGLNPPPDYVFDHANNGLTNIDLSVIEQGSRKIVVSYSTITSAMHVAAVMGAANIILCGHDCGTLDGRTRMGAYMTQDEEMVDNARRGKDYRLWLGEILPQTMSVRNKLIEVFGCRVYSLNPFVGLKMEGHEIG